MFLDPVVEAYAGGALEHDAGPVDAGAVFPYCAGLVYEGHAEDVALVGVEDVEADGAAEVAESWIEAVDMECQQCPFRPSQCIGVL